LNGLVGTICAAFISLLAVTPPSRAPVPHISSIEPLATGRLTRLRRGINASHWAMWDYQGGFNVVNRVSGRAVPDAETLAALGLKP
jgi:hypothetical protein